MYFSIHGKNTSHATRECKVLKTKVKDRPNYSTKDYKRRSREVNILEKEASHQKARYLRYKKLNKAFAKKKNLVILDDPSDSKSSSSSESHNSQNEDKETSIKYDSELVTMKKAATALLTTRKKYETTVADMDLSLIN